MGKNVNEMIEGLGEESTVEDFKNIIKSMQEDTKASIEKKDAEIKELGEKITELVTASVKRSAEENTISQEEKDTQFFKWAAKGDVEKLYKYGGRMTRNDGEWTEGDWNIGKALEEKAALGTVLRGDATTGSYLVPAAYEREVFRLAKQSSVMMGKVRTIDMAARDLYWPAENATPSLTWVTNETTAKTETNPTFSQVHLVAKTCAAWLTVTDELLEDSLVNLGDFFKQQFVEAWGQEFDKQVLISNASPFTGIAYNSSCNIRNMASGKTSFADLELDDLIDMENDISSSKGETALQGAYFIMSRYVFNVLKKLKDDNGDYIYQRPDGGQPGTIWNYPYIISDQMPGTSSDATDTPFLILGNPKYWLHGNRVGMQFQTYNNTIRNLDYDQIFYKFRIRQGFIGAIPSAFAVLETAAS